MVCPDFFESDVSVYFCTMDGFFRILKKAVSKLICTQLCILTTQQCKLFKKEVFLKPYLSYVILVRIDSKVKFISVSSMNFQTFSKCQIVLEAGLFSKPL